MADWNLNPNWTPLTNIVAHPVTEDDGFTDVMFNAMAENMQHVKNKSDKAIEISENVRNAFNDLVITQGAGTQVLEGGVVQGRWNADTRLKIEQDIPNGDLNNATKTGYYSGFSKLENLPPLAPIDVPSFTLLVYNNIYYVLQIFYSVRRTNEIFFRTQTTTTKEWTNWEKVLTNKTGTQIDTLYIGNSLEVNNLDLTGYDSIIVWVSNANSQIVSSTIFSLNQWFASNCSYNEEGYSARSPYKLIGYTLSRDGDLSNHHIFFKNAYAYQTGFEEINVKDKMRIHKILGVKGVQ